MYEEAITQFVQEAVGGKLGAKTPGDSTETTESDTLAPNAGTDMDSVKVDSDVSSSDVGSTISTDFQEEILAELQASNVYLAGIYEQELYSFAILFIILVLLCIAGLWKIIDNIVIKPIL